MKKIRIAIYNPYLETKGGGEKVCLALAEALSKDEQNSVYLLTHNEVDIASLESYFNLDLSKVGTRFINSEDFFTKLLNKLPLPGKLRNFFFDVKVSGQIKKHKYDVFINNCYQSNLPNPSPIGIYMCMFPQKVTQSDKVGLIKRAYFLGIDLLYRVFLHPTHKIGVFSYNLITANSQYTQKYIKKYWHKDSEIIYPICDDMSNGDTQKKRIILNVGRFFENSGENHHKRQDVLLDTFKTMKNLHDKGWELHFAGSVAEDVGGLKYILSLIKSARNVPVFFHFNSSYEELQSLYNEASIYWHATGFGSKVSEHPEKQEHFGITTVEAMSAGAIPIVINSAGQKETVTNGTNGYLWDTSEQLASFTTEVALGETSYVSSLRHNAIAASGRYGKRAFDERASEILRIVGR